MLMATLSFYNELQITECPYTFCSLKEKIKELYILNDNQLDTCLISFKDNNSITRYIFNETQYDKVIPIIESIILKIEIVDEKTYLSLASLLYKEFDELNLTFDNKGKNNNKDIKVNSKETQVITDNIKCNLCKCEKIEGIRYFCGICQNFNLCEKCEEKFGRAHGHPLLKIRKPEFAPLYCAYKIV